MSKAKCRVLWKLLATFFKIGLFTFGGGYAMIPLIQREAAEKQQWISDDDMLEIIAIAESTPGPIAINSATFIGYRVAGVLGAFCATFGVVLPSFVIISVITLVLREFSSIKTVKFAFFGIRAGVLALIVKAVVTLYRKSKKGITPTVITLAAFAAVAVFGMNTMLVIAICAVIGLIVSFTAAKGGAS